MGGDTERRRGGDPLLRASQRACRAGLVFWRGGDTGIALAAAAAPIFLAMSLLTECRRWSERALLAIAPSSRSRSKGAKAWELRAAIDLAEPLVERDRREEAGLLLQSALEGFAERSETADITAANSLLQTS